MSRPSPERVPETDMNATTSAAGPPTAARLKAIHDLVRTNRYDVPAMLIAERIVERGVLEGQEHGD
jgi:hypothetical protein